MTLPFYLNQHQIIKLLVCFVYCLYITYRPIYLYSGQEGELKLANVSHILKYFSSIS